MKIYLPEVMLGFHLLKGIEELLPGHMPFVQGVGPPASVLLTPRARLHQLRDYLLGGTEPKCGGTLSVSALCLFLVVDVSGGRQYRSHLNQSLSYLTISAHRHTPCSLFLKSINYIPQISAGQASRISAGSLVIPTSL